MSTEPQTTEKFGLFALIGAALGGLLIALIGAVILASYYQSWEGYVVVRPGFSASSLLFLAGWAVVLFGAFMVLVAFAAAAKSAPWPSAIISIGLFVYGYMNGHLLAGVPVRWPQWLRWRLALVRWSPHSLGHGPSSSAS
jgi:hypothetical protein